MPFGDIGSYILPGGESYDSFTGSGWTLSGGATVVTATLYDGTTATVLDLPAGAQAVTPPVCVNSSYPWARTMMRGVGTTAALTVYASYQGTKSWSSPKSVASLKAGTTWALSGQIKLSPASTTTYVEAQFTLAAGTSSSDFQIYNFGIDPYAR